MLIARLLLNDVARDKLARRDITPREVRQVRRFSLVVPFSDEQLEAIDTYAEQHDINAIQAVQRLVDEALAAHPQPRR